MLIVHRCWSSTRPHWSHPELHLLPRLLLKVDGVQIVPTHSFDIRLVSLAEVDHLMGRKSESALEKQLATCYCDGLTSSPICGTNGDFLGMTSVIHWEGLNSQETSLLMEGLALGR